MCSFSLNEMSCVSLSKLRRMQHTLFFTIRPNVRELGSWESVCVGGNARNSCTSVLITGISILAVVKC